MMIKGTVTEAHPYRGTGLMLVIDAQGRKIWQTTMEAVEPGDELDVDPVTTRIYRDGREITFIPQPVTVTGFIHPGGQS
jgi:hypothetical protein